MKHQDDFKPDKVSSWTFWCLQMTRELILSGNLQRVSAFGFFSSNDVKSRKNNASICISYMFVTIHKCCKKPVILQHESKDDPHVQNLSDLLSFFYCL